jgi:hypothetical protein
MVVPGGRGRLDSPRFCPAVTVLRKVLRSKEKCLEEYFSRDSGELRSGPDPSLSPTPVK